MTQVRLDYEAAQDVAARLTAVGEELRGGSPFSRSPWGDIELTRAATSVAEAVSRLRADLEADVAQLARAVLAAIATFEAVDDLLETTASALGSTVGLLS